MNTTRMQAIEESTFLDKCQIGIFSSSMDSYGDIQKSWVFGSEISCGAELLSGYVKIQDALIYNGIVAKIRVSKNTVVNVGDKVRFSSKEYSIKSITGKFVKVLECEGVSV